MEDKFSFSQLVKSGEAVYGGCARLAAVRKRYMQVRGIPLGAIMGPTPIDEEIGKSIADQYEAMNHEPTHPLVNASYAAFKHETAEQFESVRDAGINVVPFGGRSEPYASSTAMIADVEAGRLLFLKTVKEAFGGGTGAPDFPDAPMLAPTKTVLRDSNGMECELTYNDMFRVVHDIYGHAVHGFSFGPRGEEAAWAAHAAMYTPTAWMALANESRAQNCWVNFNKSMRRPDASIPRVGDPDYVPLSKRRFADQKAGLLPVFAYLPPLAR